MNLKVVRCSHKEWQLCWASDVLWVCWVFEWKCPQLSNWRMLFVIFNGKQRRQYIDGDEWWTQNCRPFVCGPLQDKFGSYTVKSTKEEQTEKCGHRVGSQVSCLGLLGLFTLAAHWPCPAVPPLLAILYSNTLVFWDPDTHYFDTLIL